MERLSYSISDEYSHERREIHNKLNQLERGENYNH